MTYDHSLFRLGLRSLGWAVPHGVSCSKIRGHLPRPACATLSKCGASGERRSAYCPLQDVGSGHHHWRCDGRFPASALPHGIGQLYRSNNPSRNHMRLKIAMHRNQVYNLLVKQRKFGHPQPAPQRLFRLSYVVAGICGGIAPFAAVPRDGGAMAKNMLTSVRTAVPCHNACEPQFNSRECVALGG